MTINRGKIGVFGGSFDPPHNGHIHLVLSLMEAHHLDEVLIVPSHVNPLKEPVATSEQRLQMTRLAFDGIPGCTVLDHECRRSSPSYTIDTLHNLLESSSSFREKERFLLLGADVVPSLPYWKNIEGIFAIAHPLIAARGAFDPSHKILGNLDEHISAGWTDTGLFDISSTNVRKRLHQKLYVDHLISPKVLEYIRFMHLYP